MVGWVLDYVLVSADQEDGRAVAAGLPGMDGDVVEPEADELKRLLLLLLTKLI